MVSVLLFLQLAVDSDSFVADHLCASSAIIDIRPNLNHAHGAGVVGGGDLFGPGTSQAANHLDLDGWAL